MSFEYIEVLYNWERQHSTLGFKSPMQFLEGGLIAQQKREAGSMNAISWNTNNRGKLILNMRERMPLFYNGNSFAQTGIGCASWEGALPCV